MRRPLMMPADTSARLANACSKAWRDSGSLTASGFTSKSARVPSKSIRRTGRLPIGRACHAATARSTPRTEPRVSRFDQLTQRHGRIDEADVSIGLRKIPEEPSRLWLDVFGKQTYWIRIAQQTVEQRCGVIQAADHRKGLGPPERANGKGARRVAEVVFVAVSQHQAVLDQKPLVRFNSGDEARIARINKTHCG